MTTCYDIIGDVHGCAYKLEELLSELGYRIDEWLGTYQHPDRTAIFVGDLIDRGPSQLRVLEIVKGMVDHGSAQIVMGNHEFNALAYATEDPKKPGTFLRPHTPKNANQHEAFLEQLTEAQRSYYLTWFRSLPLWLDLGEIRIVHACWHQPSIDLIEKYLGGCNFTSLDQLIKAARKTKQRKSLYGAVEVILKGPELDLDFYGARGFRDKDNVIRTEARIRWWRSGATTLKELAEVPKGSKDEAGHPYGELPDQILKEVDRSFPYHDSALVFYGHYWRTGKPVKHEDWTDTTACVDFSAVHGGTMVAYRWSGERTIDWRNYHPHGRDLIARKSAK
jgi:hypothetical protein